MDSGSKTTMIDMNALFDALAWVCAIVFYLMVMTIPTIFVLWLIDIGKRAYDKQARIAYRKQMNRIKDWYNIK